MAHRTHHRLRWLVGWHALRVRLVVPSGAAGGAGRRCAARSTSRGSFPRTGRGGMKLFLSSCSARALMRPRDEAVGDPQRTRAWLRGLTKLGYAELVLMDVFDAVRGQAALK